MVGGISNGCGKVRVWAVVARSFPLPVSFHSLGGGKLPSPERLQEVRMASPSVACGPACSFPEPRPDLRADLREPRVDLRAALRADSCGPHPLPSPSDQLSREWRKSEGGTKPPSLIGYQAALGFSLVSPRSFSTCPPARVAARDCASASRCQ